MINDENFEEKKKTHLNIGVRIQRSLQHMKKSFVWSTRETTESKRLIEENRWPVWFSIVNQDRNHPLRNYSKRWSNPSDQFSATLWSDSQEYHTDQTLYTNKSRWVSMKKIAPPTNNFAPCGISWTASWKSV